MDTLQPSHSRLSLREASVTLALMAGAALLVPSVANACRCPGEPPDATAYRQAWAVAYGTVQLVKGDPYGPGGATVMLKPAVAWKRDLPSTLIVHTSSTCAFEMREGEQVLLYLRHAENDPPTNFSTRQCFGNRRGAEAEAASQRLRHIGKATDLLP